MGITKNALIRYQALDRCFGNHRRVWYIEDLLRAVNEALGEASSGSSSIQRRQLYEDIRFMESAEGWNIILQKRRTGPRVSYRYEDSNYSINNQAFNAAEVDQIKTTALLLARFRGLPQLDVIKGFLARLGTPQASGILSFDHNEYVKGAALLEELSLAVFYKRGLIVDYKPFTLGRFVAQVFFPYYLRQYNNRWFLFGWSDEAQAIRTLALDRIESIQPWEGPFRENDLDFDTYFDDIIGVSRPDADAIDITLHFPPDQAPYILTKPLHGSQRKVRSADGLTVKITVIPNYELEQLVLSFGEKCTVVAPPDFRARIAGRIRTMLERYA
ncbi:MAG TPA: WYL domain-containing protein [Dinghuibacter sp.]|uniref:helix-turn-helix transcriptional regulator n=1 Tax=Dinghuibacter sp. TaxID=2024697 RepID=UPI002C6B5574|nr:WYL domain-containing protein [Dinghuibacter sp.]HTJ14718.1 WYL domain-containing protein [Dinghuibacter sp.]